MNCNGKIWGPAVAVTLFGLGALAGYRYVGWPRGATGPAPDRSVRHSDSAAPSPSAARERIKTVLGQAERISSTTAYRDQVEAAAAWHRGLSDAGAVDPWGRCFLTVYSLPIVAAVSAGPDRVFGSGDDILDFVNSRAGRDAGRATK
jgi:hypothetical protein